MKTPSHPIITVLAASMGFLILHFVTRWDWPVIASLLIGFNALASPRIALAIEKLLKGTSEILGTIIKSIVLTFFFYLFLFPLAVAAKLFGKRDVLRLKRGASSTFIDIRKTFDGKSFEKPW